MKTLSKALAAQLMKVNAIACFEQHDGAFQVDEHRGQVIGYGLTPVGPDGYEGEPERVVDVQVRMEADRATWDQIVAIEDVNCFIIPVAGREDVR